uniref:Uncharacterized protein n=1 Tax=Rhizophora mucronata TaxID=61149 RepID=A0A2P2Q9Z4_RHIMU
MVKVEILDSGLWAYVEPLQYIIGPWVEALGVS